MTNYEYIKEAKAEELGKWLCDRFGDCAKCPASELCSYGSNGMIKWLSQEVEE